MSPVDELTLIRSTENVNSPNIDCDRSWFSRNSEDATVAPVGMLSGRSKRNTGLRRTVVASTSTPGSGPSLAAQYVSSDTSATCVYVVPPKEVRQNQFRQLVDVFRQCAVPGHQTREKPGATGRLQQHVDRCAVRILPHGRRYVPCRKIDLNQAVAKGRRGRPFDYG